VFSKIGIMAISEVTKPEDTNQTPDCGCGPATDAPVNDNIPDAELITKLEDVVVYDKNGSEHSFKSICQLPGKDRHLIIFVRHALCVNCMEYIRELNFHIPASKLPDTTAITFISNGDPSLLNSYSATAQNSYDIYTDPSKKLYQLLSLNRTLDLGAKPSYIKSTFLSTVVVGIAMGLTSTKSALNHGDGFQVGGEFLFVKEKASNEWKVEWAHRMKNTRDHAEIPELMKLLGVEAQEGASRERTWTDNFKDISLFRSGYASSKPAQTLNKSSPKIEEGKGSNS
jgi:hypothetical protein